MNRVSVTYSIKHTLPLLRHTVFRLYDVFTDTSHLSRRLRFAGKSILLVYFTPLSSSVSFYYDVEPNIHFNPLDNKLPPLVS